MKTCVYLWYLAELFLGKGKGKVHPITSHQGPRGGVEV
jgi:hypothetical protein